MSIFTCYSISSYFVPLWRKVRLTCGSIVSKTSIIESINVYVHVRASARARALIFLEIIFIHSFADFERLPRELMINGFNEIFNFIVYILIEFESEKATIDISLHRRCIFKSEDKRKSCRRLSKWSRSMPSRCV